MQTNEYKFTIIIIYYQTHMKMNKRKIRNLLKNKHKTELKLV